MPPPVSNNARASPDLPVRASPLSFEACSDAKSDTDVALDFASELVDEQLGRQHLRPAPREVPVWAPVAPPASQKPQRPTRLEPAVPDPYTGERVRGFQEAQELPALRHLEALEQAVRSGEALAGRIPDLPTTLRQDPAPAAAVDLDSSYGNYVALGPGTRIAVPSEGSLSARGLGRPQQFARSGQALRTGGGLLAKAPADVVTSPRYFFGDEGWGMQAPLMPGARQHAPAASFGFGRSALRGVPLPQCRRGPHASALWASTEKARLRMESAKPLGSSAHVAFLQNGGPRSLESLQRGLCDPEIEAAGSLIPRPLDSVRQDLKREAMMR